MRKKPENRKGEMTDSYVVLTVVDNFEALHILPGLEQKMTLLLQLYRRKNA